MNEYNILIPIGGQLPQAGRLIQLTERDSQGKDSTTTVMVSSVRSVTWGTKQDPDDGNKEKVAGVFVTFWGAPWPPVLLSLEDMRRLKRKHVVTYDRYTGIHRTCFYSDDIMIEVSEGSCPVCAAREREKQANATKENEARERFTLKGGK